MTKCQAFWRIIGLFKEGKMHVKLPDGKKITGFKGFKEWCGGKSYSQAMREWNTFETLELLGKKLGIEPCTVLSALNLTTKSLEPLIALRKVTTLRNASRKGKGALAGSQSVPSDIQEKAIDKIIPRLLTKKMKSQEIREAIQEFKPTRERYEKTIKEKEKPVQIQEAEGKFDSKSLLNSSLEILGILNLYIEAGRCILPEPYSEIVLNIKDQISKLLDLLEEAK